MTDQTTAASSRTFLLVRLASLDREVEILTALGFAVDRDAMRADLLRRLADAE